MRRVNDREPFDGRIEMDDAHLGGERGGGKTGRGSPGKKPIVVAIQTDDEGRPRKIKLRRIARFKRRRVKSLAQRIIAPGATVVTDGLACFRGVADAGGVPRSTRCSATSRPRSSRPTVPCARSTSCELSPSSNGASICNARGRRTWGTRTRRATATARLPFDTTPHCRREPRNGPPRDPSGTGCDCAPWPPPCKRSHSSTAEGRQKGLRRWVIRSSHVVTGNEGPCNCCSERTQAVHALIPRFSCQRDGEIS